VLFQGHEQKNLAVSLFLSLSDPSVMSKDMNIGPSLQVLESFEYLANLSPVTS
jgi:hypothetical protein